MIRDEIINCTTSRNHDWKYINMTHSKYGQITLYKTNENSAKIHEFINGKEWFPEFISAVPFDHNFLVIFKQFSTENSLGNYSSKNWKNVICKIAKGVAWLEHRHMIHGEMSLDNIFIQPNGQVFFTGFQNGKGGPVKGNNDDVSQFKRGRELEILLPKILEIPNFPHQLAEEIKKLLAQGYTSGKYVLAILEN